MALKQFGAIQRWRIQLGYSTIGVFGIGIVIAKTIQDIATGVGYNIPFYILYPIGVFSLWVTGYIYDHWGFYSNEIEYASERNTYFEKHMKGMNKPGLINKGKNE